MQSEYPLEILCHRNLWFCLYLHIICRMVSRWTLKYRQKEVSETTDLPPSSLTSRHLNVNWVDISSRPI